MKFEGRDQLLLITPNYFQLFPLFPKASHKYLPIHGDLGTAYVTTQDTPNSLYVLFVHQIYTPALPIDLLFSSTSFSSILLLYSFPSTSPSLPFPFIPSFLLPLLYTIFTYFSYILFFICFIYLLFGHRLPLRGRGYWKKGRENRRFPLPLYTIYISSAYIFKVIFRKTF